MWHNLIEDDVDICCDSVIVIFLDGRLTKVIS
jgi:hypothetical protein